MLDPLRASQPRISRISPKAHAALVAAFGTSSRYRSASRRADVVGGARGNRKFGESGVLWCGSEEHGASV
jgi:hypothetical protein